MTDVDISDLPPPPSGGVDISDLPPPPDKQTLGGFGQAAGTVVPRALTDIAGIPVDTAKNLFDLGKISGVGLAQAAGGEAGETNPDEYALDVDTDHPVPGSSEWSKDQVRKLGGSALIDAKERTALNRYTQAIGEGAMVGSIGGFGSMPARAGKELATAASSDPAVATMRYLMGGTEATGAQTALRGATAGGAAGATQQAAADQGFDPGVGAALGFIAGAAAGARGPRGSRVAAREEPAAPVKSSAEKLLDTPDIAHEGAGAAVEPTPGSEVATQEPNAAPGASPAARAEPAAAAGALAASTGAEPQDMTKTPAERAAERERVAAVRDREEGGGQSFTPEPIPKRAALAEGEAARRDAESAAETATPAANNASGESAASQEAISRVAQEKEQGITRHILHQDDTTTPLTGVDAVDAKAKPGDVIVQMQDGKPTVLDRGGLPATQVNGRVNAAITKGMFSVPVEAPPSTEGILAERTQVQRQPEPSASKHPMQNGKPYTLVSAELAGQDPRMNANRSLAMEQMLQGMGAPYARTRGSFKGSQERSFAVQTPNDAMRARVEGLAGKFNQESVIHVDENGNANYRDLGNDQQSGPIGSMQKVPQHEAEAAEGWTRDKQGNYYTIKKPNPVAEAPAHKNGMGVNPPETMKSIFEGPAKEGLSQVAKTPADQAKRVDTFKQIGLSEVRKSAITGDTRQAGTELQTSKLKNNEAGDRLAGLIDAEREAIRQHAHQLIANSGGSAGLAQPDLYSRGAKMEAPINDWHQHLEDEMQDAYNVARVRAKDKPFQLDTLGNTLSNEKAQFLSTVDGKQLYEGVMARAKELGLTGPNETFNPSTVDQAERFRQYLNDAWSPRTARLIGQLKSNLDQDVMKSAGEDLFERGRNLRTLMAKTLEEPEAVSALLRTKESNKLGVNRTVAQEDVPSFITKQPFDQLRQYVSVLKQAAGANDPALRTKAITAMNETRGQFANEYVAAGDNLKGMWNQQAANKYLRENEMAMRYVYTPEEMQQFKINDDAGRWLSMDRSYPGAQAQKQNLLSTGMKKIGPAAELAGAHAAGLPGVLAGKLVGKGAESVAGYMTGKAAEKLVTQLGNWKGAPQPPPSNPEPPLSTKIPAQRGGPKPPAANMLSFRHFSNAKEDSVTLDPSYYGSGVKGAEAKRIAAGAPKVIAAYGADTPDSAIEPDVKQSRTEYTVRVPRAAMYDLSADPKNIGDKVAAKNGGAYNHSKAEKLIKAAGYTGYYLPNGSGGFKGQARFFKPVKATRVGS